jgi:selenocysteine-specific elongation factor
LPSQPAKAIATRLEAEGKIQRKNGSIVRAEQGREVRLELPPSARALLLAIEKAGTRGFERPEPAQAGFGKDFDLLNRAGLVVALDAKLSLSRRAYGELVDRLISDRIPGSFFSVPEAKAATNLSRKWVLPFLNRMERDGWVKREGEHRKVLRSAHS